MAGLFMMMQAELDVTEKSPIGDMISPVESEIEKINGRVRKLENEMHGNVEMMTNIKSKLELLMKLDGPGAPAGDGPEPNIDLPPIQPKSDPKNDPKGPSFIEHPEQAKIEYGECPVVVPYGKSNADHFVDKFIEEWDFIDIDGGVWKQGWPIKTSDAEWKSTKLKVKILRHFIRFSDILLNFRYSLKFSDSFSTFQTYSQH